MIHLTSGFMIVNPTEKKKIALVPSAVVCHIDESALFEQQVRKEKISYYIYVDIKRIQL